MEKIFLVYDCTCAHTAQHYLEHSEPVISRIILYLVLQESWLIYSSFNIE